MATDVIMTYACMHDGNADECFQLSRGSVWSHHDEYAKRKGARRVVGACPAVGVCLAMGACLVMGACPVMGACLTETRRMPTAEAKEAKTIGPSRKTPKP